MPRRWRRNARTGCSTKRTRSSSSITVPRRRRERRGQERRRARGARRRGPAAPCEGDVVEAPLAAPASAAGAKLRGSNGCSGWRTRMRSRARRLGHRHRAVDDVEQLADRDRRGARRVRALVVAGVGDDQAVAGGQQRVEQELAVLGARVALADVGVGEQRSSPSRGARRGKTPSSRPSRQTTRCGTERIGTSVQIVRWPVRKLARVGRPCRRSASSARTSASAAGAVVGADARARRRRRRGGAAAPRAARRRRARWR